MLAFLEIILLCACCCQHLKPFGWLMSHTQNIFPAHTECWEVCGVCIRIHIAPSLIFTAGADVFSPDEARLPPPSGSIRVLRFLPSAHTPVYLPPRWWSSACVREKNGVINFIDVGLVLFLYCMFKYAHGGSETQGRYFVCALHNYSDIICTKKCTGPLNSPPNRLHLIYNQH